MYAHYSYNECYPYIYDVEFENEGYYTVLVNKNDDYACEIDECSMCQSLDYALECAKVTAENNPDLAVYVCWGGKEDHCKEEPPHSRIRAQQPTTNEDSKQEIILDIKAKCPHLGSIQVEAVLLSAISEYGLESLPLEFLVVLQKCTAAAFARLDSETEKNALLESIYDSCLLLSRAEKDEATINAFNLTDGRDFPVSFLWLLSGLLKERIK